MTEYKDLVFPPTPGNLVAGLTKRELFAAMAMQAMLANNRVTDNCEVASSTLESGDLMHEWAVKHADGLIAELEKEGPE